MIKHELLAPAGNMECLKQAIFSGADAVYVGCKKFGARKFASNFTNDEIIEAIKLCHLYGVKIYATMNTLVKNDEVDSFLNQVEFLHKNGIDAILIQDFGMLCLVLEKYPNLEVHASTQANTSSKETAELFYKLGVKRVVFSREMSLEEINSIDVPIEKEVFVHGALCICYSGCCLMSSQIGHRSGNLGECAGSCRLPYTLKHNGKILANNKYLLSTKELNTSTNFKELLESNISCFKIEGRMKSPEYVGFITRFYRNLIDNYEQTNIKKANSELKTIFNRGFTTGHLFNCTEEELMNTKSPNHIGLQIGKVIEVTKDKIKMQLDKPLNQQDGIRFLNSNKGLIVNYLYNKNKKLVNTATDICYIDNKIGLTENDIVCKTIDYNLNKSLKELPSRKIPVTITVEAHINKNLSIELIDDQNNKISLQGNIVEKARTEAITQERIKQQASKLGNTPFECKNVHLKCDEEIFISIKELNDIRRSAVEKLIKKRQNCKVKFESKNVEFKKLQTEKMSPGIVAIVKTEEQLLTCLSNNIERIYTEVKPLYEKYKCKQTVFYKSKRCQLELKDNVYNSSLVSDYFDFSKYKELSGDYGLNVYNIYTAYYLHKLGIQAVTLSVELSQLEIEQFIRLYESTFKEKSTFQMLCYGTVENMIIKGNILNINKDDFDYRLTDIKSRVFPVFYDGVLTHVMNFEQRREKLSSYLKENIQIRLDFHQETKDEVYSIIKKYQ
ncbi:MAG: U32 family peptidase [Bacilli bacterium]|nr:U32 family peptidase [bacterium]MDY2697557.1 U32 family peptidase [Bacilli bacterium]